MGLFGVLEMEDAEEQRIFGGVQQHEGGALQTQFMPLSSWSLGGRPSSADFPLVRIYLLFLWRSYRDVGLVDVVFAPFLGNKQHPIEEEESTSVLGPQNMKGSLQHQLSVGGQVWTLPVDQKRLNLLQRYMKTFPFIIIYWRKMPEWKSLKAVAFTTEAESTQVPVVLWRFTDFTSESFLQITTGLFYLTCNSLENRAALLGSWRAHLNSDGMFVLPFHIIDVPGHSSHGVNGLLNDLVALLVQIQVLGNFL